MTNFDAYLQHVQEDTYRARRLRRAARLWELALQHGASVDNLAALVQAWSQAGERDREAFRQWCREGDATA